MRRFRKLIIVAFGLTVLAVIVYAYLPKPLEVTVSVVGRGPLQSVIEEEGRTRLRERYVVTAPVAAYSPRIELHVGDVVTRGALLVELRPLPPATLDIRTRAEAQARVAQANAKLAEAKKQAEAAAASAAFAAHEFERLKRLFKNGSISRSTLDQAQSEAARTAAARAAAQSSIDVAHYELQAAKVALKYSGGVPEKESVAPKLRITAPVSGAITSVNHESEGVLSAGQAIMTIGDPASMEIEVDVLSSDAVKIHPGTRVLFDRWGGPQPLEGKVRIVEPVAFTKISALGVEEQRVLVIADILTPHEVWKRLGDNYQVEARFILWESVDTLRVANSGLFRDQKGDWAVLVLQDGRIAQRRIQLGHQGNYYSAVLDGLKAGDQVIAYPDDSMQVGSRAKAREILSE